MTKHVATLCLLASASLSSTTTAFSTQSNGRKSSTKLDAVNRREILSSGVAAGLALLTSGAAQAANEVDFGKVQDLLGQDSTYSMSAQQYEQRSTKRPTFLKDPTEEFKQNEEKATAFKREQLKAKKEFQTVLDRLQTDPNDGGVLAKDLDELRYLVKKGVGLPEGITKEDVVKQVRRRKAKKFWPTEVEIAYQDLLYEILKKQSPNTDRDTDFV
uniref:RxLR effector protein n=1 Tax=Amphora coffeiformis TaxID=265554 RepID=A0A7S3LBW7_9STRA|mmetsp:Transcript_4087/g.7867  ORF Transcript_4087/g.7867 Transcript_4087/m.7867 type:complete len:215 (+) Transcript_4087:215-859(+)|eukprot:scaffold1640_cov161-Amphora_coffeaeformis.AAC.51